MRYFIFALYWSLFCLMLSGCVRQNKPDGMPALVPCTITVAQDGVPLFDANVTLHPADGNKWTGNGATDKNGKAMIFTWGTHPGIAPGKYSVTVAKVETEKLPPRPTGSGPGKMPDSFNLVDLKYGEKETTDLEIVIVKGNRNYAVDVGAAIREKIPERKS